MRFNKNMESNLINIDEMILKNSNKVFEQAVKELIENEIVFEGQFPFLDCFTMRDRNIERQREIFRRFGYSNAENIVNFSFEIVDEGWMHCFCVFGGRFEKIKYVKKAVIEYFRKKIVSNEQND
jgi:hypothetical protein